MKFARKRKPALGKGTRSRSRRVARNPQYDVVIIGGGPAGSTLGWKLASEGAKVIILDAAKFPREKVCGDYVEPRGLRILDKMGCLKKLDTGRPLPITHSATYIDGQRHYAGKIPFYGLRKDLPPHGYIVPRDVLDTKMLESAVKAGAMAHQETYVSGFTCDERRGVEVLAQRGGTPTIYHARLIAGADGVNSVVARAAGLLADDPRHIAVSQRAYADGYEGGGEAAFFFDEDFFPGYGWAFPMSRGRVNLGVGVLLETCQREDIRVPQLFREFFEKLKRGHPKYRKLKLCRPPIGGIVKTYGGAGPNYFERGVLIGDAGSFVDPMTGEGITPAMESALLASEVMLDALDAGEFGANSLSAFEMAFRKYFDPSMIFLDLCAATLRNNHFWRSWKRALVRGCELAQRDARFARTAGACFGGLDISPPGILAQLWVRMAEGLLAAGPQSAIEMATGQVDATAFTFQEMAGWMGDWWNSALRDPLWHASWATDVQRKWIRALAVMSRASADPRAAGLIRTGIV
jgi:geranylgeranyl reductase family protein